MIWIWEGTLYLNLLSNIFQEILSGSGTYSEEKGHTEDSRTFSKIEDFSKSGMTLKIQGKQKLSENGVKRMKLH